MADPVSRTIDTRRSFASVAAIIGATGRALQGRGGSQTQLASYWAGEYAREYYAQVHRAFKTKSVGGTDIMSNKWEPLAPSTIKQKKRNKNKILQEEQNLEKSLRPGKMNRWSYRPYNRDQIYAFTGSRIQLGTRDKKAGYHQTGTRRMPARPPFPTNDRKMVLRAVRQATLKLRDRLIEVVT